MRHSLAIGGVLIIAVIAAATFLRWRSAREAAARTESAAAIQQTSQSPGEPGWVETFDAPRSLPLVEYDSNWRPIFGRLIVDQRLGAAIGDPDGGWHQDGGDDYAFRASESEASGTRIVVDGWWDGQGSIGALGAVQSAPPHRLYEAALWRGKLAINYFIGPRPDQFETLAESSGQPMPKGRYRLVFCLARGETGWRLHATLLDPDQGYRKLAEASAIDSRLEQGGQGIGILGGGGPRSSFITGMSVQFAVLGQPVPYPLAGCEDRPTMPET